MTTALAAAQPRSEMSLNVPPEFERAIRERVESGAYASEDAVFRACLEALGQWEAEQEAKLEALRTEIRAGVDQLERGQVADGHEAFARARARLLEKAASRDALHPR